jgi:hypothetical protein
LETTYGPEDIFSYAYAVFHSPTYRQRYSEFLKGDFPRLPLTGDQGLFATLVGVGAKLTALHLMETPALDNLITSFPVTGSNVVEKVRYNEAEEMLFLGGQLGGETDASAEKVASILKRLFLTSTKTAWFCQHERMPGNLSGESQTWGAISPELLLDAQVGIDANVMLAPVLTQVKDLKGARQSQCT